VVGVAGGGGGDGVGGVVGGGGQGGEGGGGGGAAREEGFGPRGARRRGAAVRLHVFERAVIVAPEAALHVDRRAAGVG